MSIEPVPLAISNPGFEADFVSEGCFEVLFPAAWPVYDPNGILNGGGNSVGGLNLPPGSVFFPAGAPQGDHAALVFLSSTIGAGPAGLTQVLGDTLQADTTYTLTVQVGNIASGIGPPPCDVFGFFDLDGFPGYQVQLLAGGVVIAEDDNSLAATIPEGEFRLSTIQVSVGNTHPQLGDPLEIRLINLNVADTPGDPGIEVDFDDVRLVAQPACAAVDGDFDTDCDVDLDDFGQFRLCVGGPNQRPSKSCPPGVDADLDGDLHVDLIDYAIFSASFTDAREAE
ncbi:MAG: hypothetical protein IH987_07005 [Planctomycetes bacterium]|nr:hypothetical protein [Planctomycetota bacterium]